jgi:alpha-ketoglutarate-dependent 2,4-dichlorophenoxyacetate dioxygenase
MEVSGRYRAKRIIMNTPFIGGFLMAISITQLHPTFVGDVGPVNLRTLTDEADLNQVRSGMDQYAVLVFHNQELSTQEQADFLQRLDGVLHTQTGSNAVQKNRFGIDAVSDVSNVDAEGKILGGDDRRRLQRLGNRLWHTDASFINPAGRYSALYAHILPPVPSDTEFADMRTAYDALTDEQKTSLDGLVAHHSIAYSRSTLGFEFSKTEKKTLEGAYHPLVRILNGTDRKSLYLGAHVSMVEGMPIPEGRLLVRDLMEHATQTKFVFKHSWQQGDLVIWDNRTTLHRATAFDDTVHVREMRRVTTLDINSAVGAAPTL